MKNKAASAPLGEDAALQCQVDIYSILLMVEIPERQRYVPLSEIG